MGDERKKITEFKADEWRQERKQNRLDFFKRLRGIVKFILVITAFVLAFNHRAEIQNLCYATFDRVMNYLTVPSQARQKAADYQNQLDGIVTN
jgi:hypothetical protein